MDIRQTTLAIDFDGTIVEHDYPNIGKLRKGAIEYINKLHEDGFYIIIWTVRDGQDQENAENFLKENSIHYDKINENSDSFIEHLGKDPRFGVEYEEPRKICANIYIDDRNLGGIDEWKDLYKAIKIQHELNN